MGKNYRGVYAVVCTPFNEKGKVDEEALRRLLRWLVDDCKVHGIIPCGSTGEFAFLTEQERKLVVAISIDEVKKQLPVIVGAAACATGDVIDYSNCYKDMGADGVMVVPSYYGHLNQDELYYHYSTIAENVDLPIVVYNNPGTSGSDILPATIARLAELDNIVALKESSGIMQRVMDINLLAGDKIEVLCGCDTLALEMFMMGVEGWIAAQANVAAKQCVKLYQMAVEQKDITAAKAFYNTIRPLFDLFEGSGQYVQLAKAGLEMIGHSAGEPRKPLLPVSPELKDKLKSILTEIEA